MDEDADLRCTGSLSPGSQGGHPSRRVWSLRSGKEPEAVKEEIEVEVSLKMTVRNGKGGRAISRWVVLSHFGFNVDRLRVAADPVLLLGAQRSLPATLKVFVDGHGGTICEQLRDLQVRVAREGIVEVMVGPEEELNLTSLENVDDKGS
jgi:hypothetical protein